VRRQIGITCVVAVIACWASAAEAAVTFGFTRISANSPQNIFSQLSVEVEAGPSNFGQDQIDFTFYNATGGQASSITDIFFDDQGPGYSLFQPSSPSVLQNVSKTNFGTPENVPNNLPYATNISPAFVTSSVPISLSAGSEPEMPHAFALAAGMNPGESVTVRIGLATGKTLADVLAALQSGDLRIGLFAQGLPGSTPNDSYVNWTVPDEVPVGQIVLPEPASMAIWGLGSILGSVMIYRRKRK
jgi:hypothetical protein